MWPTGQQAAAAPRLFPTDDPSGWCSRASLSSACPENRQRSVCRRSREICCLNESEVRAQDDICETRRRNANIASVAENAEVEEEEVEEVGEVGAAG